MVNCNCALLVSKHFKSYESYSFEIQQLYLISGLSKQKQKRSGFENVRQCCYVYTHTLVIVISALITAILRCLY